MLSGGSTRSASVTWAARTVTVQVSACVKSVSGLSVNDALGLALVVNVCEPEVAQEIVKLAPLALTDSLKLIVTFVAAPMSVAPFVGVVELTDGAASIVNEKTKSAAMLFGGSNASTSVTPAARTVTVQVSPCVKSVSGFSVNVVCGLALVVNVW